MPNFPKPKLPQTNKLTGPLAMVASTVKHVINSQNKMVSDLLRQFPGGKQVSVPKPPSPRDRMGTSLRWGGKPKSYNVATDGETFVSVARKFNVSVSDLVELNSKMGVLTSADAMRPRTVLAKGDKIYIPIFS